MAHMACSYGKRGVWGSYNRYEILFEIRALDGCGVENRGIFGEVLGDYGMERLRVIVVLFLF
jgi:hypothetical protein